LKSYRKRFFPGLAVLLFSFVITAAQGSRTAAPTDQSPPADQESLKVFTEEVRLPVLALDEYGHYDPSLELDDILILEDSIPQEVKSVRHVPSSVLLLLDTGGDGVGLGGMSKRTWTTREAARQVIARLPQGDAISIIGFNDTVD